MNRGLFEDHAAASAFLAKRFRATRAAAAAPKRMTIGGAGTGAGGPPLDPVLPWWPLLLQPPFELQPLLVLQPLLLDPWLEEP